MDLSIVIPAHNEEARLGAQLEALLGQETEADWEVVVVDNGSTDGTADLVLRRASTCGRLRLVRADDRADKAYALNVGVASTAAPSVAFCDADDIVAPGWVDAMARALGAHDVVTGPNELDRLNERWLAGSRGRSIEEPVGNFAGIFPTVRGNNHGVRRDVWDRVGPLAEGLRGCEDTEFSLRCWLHGVDIVGVPEAVVHYRYRSSAGDLWRQGWAYGAGRPFIAALLRQAGKPRPPRFGGWRSWVLLVVALPGAVTRKGRARVAWIAGNRLGQVAGSIRHRTVML